MMMKKIPLIVLLGCFVWWASLVVLNVFGETATLQVKGGKVVAKGGNLVGTLVVPPTPVSEWTLMTSNAAFGAFSSGTAAWSYSNKLWFANYWTNNGSAGGAGNNPVGKTWYSTDGVTWTDAAYPAYGLWAGGAGCVFSNKMIFAGGNYGAFEHTDDTYYDNEEVFRSTGISWISTGIVEGRTYPVCIADENHAWVMGGERGENTHEPGMLWRHDVWSSPDGVSWSEVVDPADWSGRSRFGGLSYNGKLWIFGGSSGRAAPVFKNDVWWSTNGVNWTQATASAAWSARDNFGYVVCNNRMYLVGGRTALNTATNDVWYSTDGTNWTCELASAPFAKRRSFGCISHNGKIWVIGGNDGRGYQAATFYSDVWRSP